MQPLIIVIIILNTYFYQSVTLNLFEKMTSTELASGEHDEKPKDGCKNEIICK